MPARVSVSEFPLPIPGRLAPTPRVPVGTAVRSAAFPTRRFFRKGPLQLCLNLLLLSFIAPIPSSGFLALKGQDAPYVWPADPQVRERLEEWRDLKFGLLMHWGLYAQLGIVESWALCSEDQPSQDRGGMPYTDFKEMYFGMIREFNPAAFDPEPWARAARQAGMRYVIFTTKHHDGFSMWDTRETDFRITGPESPFRDHPRANVAREIFDAFREREFMVGAYFSKADWHHPDYWSPLWATPDRNTNYDTGKYPEMWERFKSFTHRQVEELMTTMGPMDILWLDAGWIRPDSTINEEVLSWGYDVATWDQSIDMPRLVEMARTHQPGLLVVDRTVHGPYENYRTPEQHVPPEGFPYPWEANLTITQSWGHTFTPEYKSVRDLIHTLIDVVAKGGNFLLNVAPTPDGRWEDEAYRRLEEIGGWMEVNGTGIHGTRKFQAFGEGDTLRFTRSKDGSRIFIFALDWPGDTLKVKNLSRERLALGPGDTVSMLGWDGPLDWRQDDEALRVPLTPEMREAGHHAWGFQIRKGGEG